MNRLPPLMAGYLNYEPGEHLLSWLGRYAQRTASSTLRRAAADLSDDDAKFSPMTPWRPIYGDIARCIHSHDRDDLIGRGSPLRYFSRFHTDRTISAAAIKKPGGFFTVRNVNLWKWCPLCAEEQREVVGYAYFRLKDQLPAIKICVRHHVKLVSACSHCGVNWSSLNTLMAPLLHAKCPECGKPIGLEGAEDSDLLRWIQLQSCLIVDGIDDLGGIDELQKAYRAVIGVAEIEQRPSIQQRKRISECQKEVEFALGAVDLQRIFSNVSEKNGHCTTPAISVYRAAYGDPESVHPLVHLLLIHTLLNKRDVKSAFISDGEIDGSLPVFGAQDIA